MSNGWMWVCPRCGVSNCGHSMPGAIPAAPGPTVRDVEEVYGVRAGMRQRPSDEAVASELFRRRRPSGEWTPGGPATEQALEDVRDVRAAERAAGAKA